jgi:ribosomal protein L7/L12
LIRLFDAAALNLMGSLILATLIGLGIGIILPGQRRQNLALLEQVNHRLAELERKVNLLLAGRASEAVPSQNCLVLEAVPTRQKIKVIKVLRRLTQLDLKAAKDLVESTPSLIPALKIDAVRAKSELEAVGAQVSFESTE